MITKDGMNGIHNVGIRFGLRSAAGLLHSQTLSRRECDDISHASAEGQQNSARKRVRIKRMVARKFGVNVGYNDDAGQFRLPGRPLTLRLLPSGTFHAMTKPPPFLSPSHSLSKYEYLIKVHIHPP